MKKHPLTRLLNAFSFGSLLLLVLVLWVPTALADGSGQADVMPNQGCMQDVAGFNLVCTANDVRLARATNIIISDDGCTFPGDTVTFSADFELLLTAQARHDVGIWFSQDGDPNRDGSITGVCTAVTPAYAPDPPWLDLDGTIDPIPGTNKPSGVQDTCGDIDDNHNPLYPRITLTVACVDTDGDGYLNLPNCTSWRQPGDNDLCISPSQAVPGAPSKCRCDAGFNVNITISRFGTIEVFKDLNPATDTGRFNLQIDGVDEATDVGDGGSTGSVTVSAGTTAVPGAIHTVGETAGTGTDLSFYGASIFCTDGADTVGPTAGTGPVDVPVEPDDAWICTITNNLSTFPPDLSVQKDNDANQDRKFSDTETYPGTTPADFPVTITYQVQITNNSTSDATITAIGDDLHDITGYACDALLDTTIAAGETKTCTFDATYPNGNSSPVTNTFTVTATNSAGADTASDTSTVNFVSTPALDVAKSSTTTAVTAAGQVVPYTFVVTNIGNVTLTGLTVADPMCDAAPTYQSGDTNADSKLQFVEAWSYSCSHTVTQAEIDGGGNLSNTVTADSNESDPDTDTLDIPITQTPLLDVTKTSSTTAVTAAGQVVPYTFVATNIGNVTLTGLTVSDPMCDASPTYQSGDTNADSKLQFVEAGATPAATR